MFFGTVIFVFGYLKPYYDELKIRDFRLYKSVYCGLCKSMGKNYGFISRISLSYDCTMLAMLYISLKSEKYNISGGRCPCFPIKKCSMCKSEGNAFEFSGAVCIILAYYKLYDTIIDSGFFKKIKAHIIRAVLHRSYMLAKKKYPQIESIAQKMINQQIEIENKKENSNIDISAEPTAKAMADILRIISGNEKEEKILEVFGYFLGRWIYLADAADDIEKDIKNKNFNPFIKKHIEKYNGDIKKTMIYCDEVLNMTYSQLVMAYDLIDICEYKNILDNIIYDGIPLKQKYFIHEKYKK